MIFVVAQLNSVLEWTKNQEQLYSCGLLPKVPHFGPAMTSTDIHLCGLHTNLANLAPRIYSLLS